MGLEQELNLRMDLAKTTALEGEAGIWASLLWELAPSVKLIPGLELLCFNKGNRLAYEQPFPVARAKTCA